MVKILKAIITLLVAGAAASGFLAKLAEKHQHEPTAGGSSSYAPPSSTMEWNSMNLYTGGGSSSTAASQQQPGASMRGQMRSQVYFCKEKLTKLLSLPVLTQDQMFFITSIFSISFSFFLYSFPKRCKKTNQLTRINIYIMIIYGMFAVNIRFLELVRLSILSWVVCLLACCIPCIPSSYLFRILSTKNF